MAAAPPSQEIPNDRLSPYAAASSLTVAVPFGICTRFPILPQDLPDIGGTKMVIYFLRNHSTICHRCQLKIRNKVPVCRFGLLGEALQLVQIHPAEHRIVFFTGDPAVKGSG